MDATSLAAIEAGVGDVRKCRQCGAVEEQFREASQ